jgi:hypothetical protein
MKIAVALLAALAILPATAQAGPGDPFTDVSSAPVIARDLRLAAEYWHATPCTAVSVIVGPMAPAQGNDGVVIPGSEIWAETALYSCTINISLSMWQAAQSADPAAKYAVCTTFAHELGHSLGLADSASSPGNMMDASPVGRRDPLCRWMARGVRR